MSPATFSSEALAAGTRVFEKPWVFITGVADLERLPAADRPEIAFAGRSNVGKSSLINALVRQKSLARTSKTPGRTQELNFFGPADGAFYLVDMPGYGYAKAPKKKIEAWISLVNAYLGGRATLQRVFMLIDSRHGLMPADHKVMRLLDTAAVSFQGVLTKADKLDAIALAAVIETTEKVLEAHPAAFPHVLVTSAEQGLGIEELRATIATMLLDRAPSGGASRSISRP
jgi:GTP-binding protein